ncbi:LamG domain-containing protein, partial [Candidatus Falkowbacteria bacterium]|nr:LamG domain-containing protein [Candidatus Falkowbacteria bacterium]
GAMSFDGTDDYVEVGDDASLDITDEITVSAWIKYSVDPDDFNGIILRKGVAMYYLYSRTVSDELQFNLNVNAAHADILFSDLQPSTWYHIVGTYDKKNIRIYLNSVLKEEVAYTTAISTDNVSLFIGINNDLTLPFDGLIDDVKIYNYARTGEEVRKDYNSGYGVYFR